MKKWFRGLALGTLACVAMQAGGCALLPQEEVLPDAPVMRQDAAEAFTMTYVQRGDLVKEQRFSVNYRAVRQEKLHFEVDGLRLEENYISKGDSVKAGQLLMELEQGELAGQLTTAQEQCDNLKLQIAQAEEEMALAEDEYALQLKYMDEEELEEADTMEEYLHSRVRSIERLQNDLTLAEATLNQVKESIRIRQLRAGIDGVVTFVRDISARDLSSITEVVVRISDSDSATFVVETKYTDLFTPGQELTINMQQKEYPCRVITPQEAGADGIEEVYLKSDLPTAELSDGDSGSLMLETERYEDILYVEKSAVKSMDGQHFVYVQDENGYRSIHKVTVGHTLNGYTEITSGLKEGDAVILK